MIAKIITILSGFIVATISTLGYSGVVLLMAIESACIPLPSEIIMPFSGYLVSTGELNLWGVAVAGAVGCVLGSLVAYWIGMYGGRPFIEKYGRYILLSRHDLDIADRWFAKHGEIIVFVSRSHLHRVSGRRGANESDSFRDLHLCRLAAMVSWPGLCRTETR